MFNERQLTLTASLIAGNDASGDGGGILSESACSLANCTVSANNAGGNGGGISVNDSGDPALLTQLVHCTVARNVASSRQGSGIFNAGDAPVELASSIVAVNDPGRPIEPVRRL